MDEFYLVLRSTSSGEYFPENKANDYKVKLHKEKKLPGTWQCALVEILYPRLWPNVSQGSNSIVIIHEYGAKRIEIPPGYYPGGVQLQTVVNDAIAKSGLPTESVRLSFNEYSRRMHLFINPGYVLCMAGGEDLSKVIGADVNTEIYSASTDDERRVILEYVRRVGVEHVEARIKMAHDPDCFIKLLKKYLNEAVLHTVPDSIRTIVGQVDPEKKRADNTKGKESWTETVMNYSETFDNLNTIFIYGSVVRHRKVGHGELRLLRVVNVTGSHGEMIHREFLSPHYLPIDVASVEVVNIELTDSNDRKIDFSGGEVFVTLHFKQISKTKTAVTSD